MKNIKKLPKIVGSIGQVFNRDCIYYLCTVTNAQSDVINYLVEVIGDLEKRITELENKMEENNETTT